MEDYNWEKTLKESSDIVTIFAIYKEKNFEWKLLDLSRKHDRNILVKNITEYKDARGRLVCVCTGNELSILSQIQYVRVMDSRSTWNDRVRESETNRVPCSRVS